MKAAFGLTGIVAAVLFVYLTERLQLTHKTFMSTAFALLLATRLGVFTLVFGIFQFEPSSDVLVYYEEAQAILNGSVPLVDISTAYGPLFDYILAIIISIWNDAAAIILFSIIVELLAFPIWMHIARLTFDEITVRRATILYICNPIAITNIAIAGENQVWLSLFLGLSLLALYRNRDLLSGVLLGASIITVKFLSLLFAPILFLAAGHSLRWAAAFLAVPAVGYGTIYLVGGEPLQQVLAQANDQSSGNIPYLLTVMNIDITNDIGRIVSNVVGLTVLCLAFVFVYFRTGLSTSRQTILMSAFVFMVTMVVSKKAYADYMVVVLFPLCLAMMMTKKPVLIALLFASLSAVATIEPSLWFRWMELGQLDILMDSTLPSNQTRLHVVLFFICELLLISGYLWILTVLYAALRDGRQESPRSELTRCVNNRA